tara:strand:+ start:616 stop:909 length:294 start_codon:yes stop_codon:yes gene_type:complete
MVPPTGRSRLESFLKGRAEWCISRQRAWGVPIPVFYRKRDGTPLLEDEALKHVQRLFREHGSSCWWTMPVSELLPPARRARPIFAICHAPFSPYFRI